MKENNLCCLVDQNNEHVTLDLLEFSELSQKPEINLEVGTWKSQSCGWQKIGEGSGGRDQIRFIFDRTNLKHLKKAFEQAQNFQR